MGPADLLWAHARSGMCPTKPGICPTIGQIRALRLGPIGQTRALPALDSLLLVLAVAYDVNGPRRPGMGSLDLA